MTDIRLFELEDGLNYKLELWGASTKHPDVVYNMKNYDFPDWVDKTNPRDVKTQVFQWLLKCASDLYLPFGAEDLARYALENWLVWKD